MQLRQNTVALFWLVLLVEGMTMTETFSLHAADGKILWCWAINRFDDPKKYVGTLPYVWIDKRDHSRVKAALNAAARGKTTEPCRYLLRPDLYEGRSWQVQTHWVPGPSKEMPIAGISRTLLALPKLTKSQIELLLLIPDHNTSGIAALLRKTSSSVRASKSKLAKKLRISQAQLTSFAISYASSF